MGDALPEPYYQDEAVTIYHGDCREIEEHYCEIAVKRIGQEVLNLGGV